MMPASARHALVGAWNAQLTFTGGARQGEDELLRLTFLPDGVIVGYGRTPGRRRAEPPGAGEWTAEEDHFSYWLNAVVNDPSGRPTTVVHAHGRGTLAPDRQTLIANGGSEVYGPSGELLMINHADLLAARAQPSHPSTES